MYVCFCLNKPYVMTVLPQYLLETLLKLAMMISCKAIGIKLRTIEHFLNQSWLNSLD